MKKLDIITRPEKLEAVKQVLDDLEIHGMTVTMVSGCGLQKGRTEYYRGTEISINILPKVRIEVVLDNMKAENVITHISEAVRTGNVGDGKIFITDIEDVVKIRTGERGKEAL